MVFQEQLTITTSGHGDMHDLTDQVSAVVARSKVLPKLADGMWCVKPSTHFRRAS